MNYFRIGYIFGSHNFKIPQIYTTNETLAHAQTHIQNKGEHEHELQNFWIKRSFTKTFEQTKENKKKSFKIETHIHEM